MKIINLLIQNFQRIKAIEINPDGHFNIIAGDNAQGKTSVLHAIWKALGGRKCDSKLPLRKGEDSGKIVCELDDYIVTRTFTEKGEYLKVEPKGIEGATLNSPQSVLDKIIGDLTFDPLEFVTMKSDKQLETLKKLVGLDFTEMDEKRKELFDERTLVNRDIKSLDNQINAIKIETGWIHEGDSNDGWSHYKCGSCGYKLSFVKEENNFNDCKLKLKHEESCNGLPAKEIRINDLLEELERRQDVNKEYDKITDEYNDKVNLMYKIKNEIPEIEKQIDELKAKMNEKKQKIKDLNDTIVSMQDQVDNYKCENTQEIRDRIQNVEAINTKIRTLNKRRELETQQEASADKSMNLSKQIGEIDQKKEDMIKNAKFPVPNLSFDDTGVLLNGKPFSQASSAEQVETSVGMGIVTNPELRVLLIRNGSIMDREHMERLSKMAELNDYQIWVERVGTDDSGAIIIEDGMVKE